MNKIEDKEVSDVWNYLDPVTYVPAHAKGNAGHKDCEKGVFIRLKKEGYASVLYCNTRTVQVTSLKDLVFG